MNKCSNKKSIEEKRKHPFYLVVKSQFLTYQVGDSISDSLEIENILSSDYLQSILKVSYPPSE